MIAPPGHFYSPWPSIPGVQADDARIFEVERGLKGIDVRADVQLALLAEWSRYYREMPLAAYRRNGERYQFENPAYSYGDGTFLHCMIRHSRPRRIVEVGSGWSSCVMLDTNDAFFDGEIECTFIDPYPETLLSLLKPHDRDRVRVIQERVQDVDPSVFESLEANDILFIDSTHVSKTGSDVNYEVFEVLPRLSAGVYIHFHDLFYPFEYPRDWVYEGRAWNEAYLLRGFLEFNHEFEIVMWNDYLAKLHRERLEELMPECLRNTGASLWLRRTARTGDVRD
jgi:hypothetical protein